MYGVFPHYASGGDEACNPQRPALALVRLRFALDPTPITSAVDCRKYARLDVFHRKSFSTSKTTYTVRSRKNFIRKL